MQWQLFLLRAVHQNECNFCFSPIRNNNLLRNQMRYCLCMFRADFQFPAGLVKFFGRDQLERRGVSVSVSLACPAEQHTEVSSSFLPAAHLGRIFCVSIEDDTCGSLAVFSDFARSEDVAFLSSRVQKPHRLDYHTVFSRSKRSNSE